MNTPANVEFIHPDALRLVWPFCKPRLERMREDWIPEDVYHACMAGRATLHTISEGGRITGFLVLEQTQEFGTRSLHVWICCHDGVGDDAVYQTVVDEFERCAKACGASRIRFSTHRNGWARRLAQYGFANTVQILEKQL